MTLMHEIETTHPNRKKRRIGRGGKRGTYSGRGQKGQRARAGRNIKSQEREALLRIPQKRGTGFDRRSKNRGRNLVVINISVINRAYTEGETVSPKTLMAKKVIARRFSRMPLIKILSQGEVTKRLIVKGCDVSKSVREKIERAGGTC